MDVASLPRTPDLGIICTAAEKVPAMVRECGEAGIRGLIIMSAGFRETGEEGKKLEERIREHDLPREAFEWYLEGCRLDEDPTSLAKAEEAYHRAIHLDPEAKDPHGRRARALVERRGSIHHDACPPPEMSDPGGLGGADGTRGGSAIPIPSCGADFVRGGTSRRPSAAAGRPRRRKSVCLPRSRWHGRPAPGSCRSARSR